MLEAIKQAIEMAENVLVITHVGPDGGALGALTAVGLGMRQWGKQVALACDDGLLARFQYLAMGDEILDEAQMRRRVATRSDFDLIIAVDCGDEQRMGRVLTNLPGPRPTIINIDHHITNTRFGSLNLVEPAASSTAEVLYDLFKGLGIVITPEIAVSLLTGIVTDSQSFSTPNVTAHTLAVSGALMEAGADLSSITRQALKLSPVSMLWVWRAGLNNMQIEDGLIWTGISSADRAQAGLNGLSTAGLASLLGDVEQAKISVVLLETDDGQVTVSWRCRPPYDVSELAASLGGGGHPGAAGCTLRSGLPDAVALVVRRSQETIRQQDKKRRNAKS